MTTTPRDWHRLFGLVLGDFFTNSPFEVELEKDLSQRKQLLDVVIIRRGKGRFAERLPDGLDPLAEHNLITFKSHQEALDDWALKELTGHYVNYRKQANPGSERLLPEEDFRLFAVCGRYPHNLANAVKWEPLQEGVYRCRRGTDVIRVIVAGELPQADHNAMFHLFSASGNRIAFGARHYRPRTKDTSTVVLEVLQGFQAEGLDVPYTIEDFRRDYARKYLQRLTPEERLEGLSAEERLEGLSVEEIERLLEQLKAKEAGQPKPRRKRR